MTPWEIRTIEFANCNCAYGCPCQFNAYPTHGNCEAVYAIITEGHYGDVKLDGLRFGGVFEWPKAIHEGNGKAQPFVDERAIQWLAAAEIRGRAEGLMASSASTFRWTRSTQTNSAPSPAGVELDKR